MTGFLLDTNCISEMIKVEPEPRMVHWIEEVDERQLFLSVLTLGEIRKGIAGLAAGKQRAKLDIWLELELKSRFYNRILAIDADIAERWGELSAIAKAHGKPLPVIDGLLAATALHHQLAIVTRNVSDFAQTDVAIVSPWQM